MASGMLIPAASRDMMASMCRTPFARDLWHCTFTVTWTELAAPLSQISIHASLKQIS